jgi:hypothetical protein
LLRFHNKNDRMNAPQYYVLRMLPVLTCQRLMFRLIGVPLGKSVTSQRNRNAPDVVTRRYGNVNMAEHTTT